MFAVRLFGKLKNGVSRSLGFSGLSRSWSSTSTCVIRGISQDICLPSTMFESLADHEAQFPLMTRIPHGELIMVNSGRPFLMSEHWRKILFSGFLHSHFCKMKGDCIVNAYDFNNVGVLKGLNLLAFKKFDRQTDKTNSGHMEYCAFVEDMFTRGGSTSLKQQFPECASFLNACGSRQDEDVLRHHSFFLEDEEIANLYSDKHRLLRQELKHRGEPRKAMRILRGLDACYSNRHVVNDCEKHLLLRHLLGNHSTMKMIEAALQGGQLPSLGTALVDVHRIAVQHAIEDNLLTDALTMNPEEHKLLGNYTRVDLIRTLRYMFPEYPAQSLILFNNEQLWSCLQMARRLPIPSIYYYVSPPPGHLVSTEANLSSRMT